MTENKSIFSGQSRIFFLLLALAFLAQGILFFRQKTSEAFNLLNEDFKIAVVLNNANAQETQNFTKKLDGLKGVKSVRYLNAKEALGMPGASSEQNGFEVFLPKEDFLPAFFEIRVNEDVILNPKVWVSENFSKMPEDAQAYYKESQAQNAIYLNGIVKYVNILCAIVLFCFLAFCFFVEAYYTRITGFTVRLGGVLCGLLSYVLAGVLVFIMADPLKIAAKQGFAFDLWPQVCCLVLSLMLGWTLAKWKKF